MMDCIRSRGRLLAIVLVAGTALSSTALSGCGGSSSGTSSAGSGSSGTSPGTSAPATTNQAPVISGKAPTTVAAGNFYNFVPTATDADKDSLTFSIDSMPSWASFDTKTGRLSGTPTTAAVGSHEDIVVKVTDGKATASLPAFAVNVTPAVGKTGSATLSWQAPQTNTDGSAAVNLSGYKIHYGTKSGTYFETISIDTVGITTYVVENLAAGTYYFAITAVSGGVESDYSKEASKTIS
jgi:hypothetical protein